jgi:hypothetical protein
MTDLSPEERAVRYAELSGIELNLKIPLGDGTDGKVWESNRKTAIKAFERERGYWLETGSYERLMEFDVSDIDGLTVPQLIGKNDELLVIEITIVSPPFILDFAKVRIDRPPDFSPEVLRDWDVKGSEEFGARWEQVKDLLRTLEGYGIYYLDPRPGNITFDDEDRL